jgi:hypothetical protein
MDMTYWGKFREQPIFLHEEGGQYYISASDNPEGVKFWVDKLIELYNDRPDYEMTIGSETVKMEELGELLNEINNFLGIIKNP